MVSFHFRKEWYKNPISDKYRNVVIKVPLNESMKEKKEENGSIFEKWQPTYNVGAVNAGRDYILYSETSLRLLVN